MIREDLLELQYYFNRLSKFMQESYGINDQVETFWSLLDQANKYYDEFFNELNIFNLQVTTSESELLNNIGKIFNCERNFTIPIYSTIDPNTIDGYRKINLTDEEYILYIKCQVIKQNFDGRRETLQQLYSTYIDNVNHPGILEDMYILYDNGLSSADCNIRWNKNPEEVSENLKLLFENGYLTIESMGITYHRIIENFNNFGYFVLRRGNEILSQPGDWPTEPYGYKYYKKVTPADPSEWDDNYTYIFFNNGEYHVLENKPVNWDTSYTNYIPVEPIDPADIWAPNTYYSIGEVSDTNRFYEKKYVLDNVDGEYSITTSAATSTFDSDNIYGILDTNDYIILNNEPVNWMTAYSQYLILTITPLNGPRDPNENYYTLEEVGGIFA